MHGGLENANSINYCLVDLLDIILMNSVNLFMLVSGYLYFNKK